jgi:hypothetical protein
MLHMRQMSHLSATHVACQTRAAAVWFDERDKPESCAASLDDAIEKLTSVLTVVDGKVVHTTMN